MITNEANLTSVEIKFNQLACVPVVAIFSSMARITASKIQFTIGCALGAIGLVGQMIHSVNPKWEAMSNKGAEHITHGVLNNFRGIGEFLLSITLIGPLFLLAYQVCSENEFAPIYKYSSLAQLA